MVRVFIFPLLLISFYINAANPRWDNSIDINDPKLTVKIVAQQCHKSLINAPEQLEKWCEKAISMGYWNALVPLSLHSGNGKRLVQEAMKRVGEKEPKAYGILAWLYEGGMFVKQDIDYAISLHEELLTLDINLSELVLTSTHNELAKLYTMQKKWLLVSKHAQYVINHSSLEHVKENAIRLMTTAKEQTSLKTIN